MFFFRRLQRELARRELRLHANCTLLRWWVWVTEENTDNPHPIIASSAGTTFKKACKDILNTIKKG